MSEKPPFISIIIPTCERPTRRLSACLRSFQGVNYPKNRFEVILVDNGSPVPPHDIVNQYRNAVPVSLVVEQQPGTANARNVGAGEARGEYVAFTDDDCEVDPMWLQVAAEAIVSNPNQAVCGRSVNAIKDNIFSSASHYLVDYLNSFYNQDPDHPRFFDSNNVIVKKSLFHDIGGFTTAFSLGGAGADREFSDRWLRAGYKALYIPELKIYHWHRLNLRSFWKQHFNYGKAAFCYRRTQRNVSGGGLKLEKMSFYVQLLVYPFKKEKLIRAMRLHLLIVLSQFAIFSGFMFEKKNASKNSV